MASKQASNAPVGRPDPAPVAAAEGIAAVPARRWAALRLSAAYLAGLFAAAILAVAAFAKAGDPALFFDQITGHGVTPAAWSPLLAYFFIAAELALAAGFLAFIWPRLLFTATVLMMLVFIVVTAVAWALGNTGDCGCFGRLVERGPRDVIVEDAVVILTSLGALWLLWTPGGLRGGPLRWLFGGPRARGPQWAVAVPLLLVAGVLTLFGPALPIDTWVVGLDRGDDLSDMALSGVRFPLDEGWVLIALVGPDCAACDEGVPALKEIATMTGGPRVVAAHPGTAADAQVWRLKNLPNFPVGYEAARSLRQYYRALPTTFLLHDGTLDRAWWGRVPLAVELAAALPPAALPPAAH